MNRRVLVVGAGPVGLTLALQLKRFGVPVDLIERGSSAGSYSKALSLNAASLKAFHGLSLQEEIARAGKAISDIYLYSGGRRFSHIDKHRLGGLYDYYLSLPQPRTEEVLREKLCSLGGVVHYGHELVHLRQIPGGVEATIRAHQDNRTDFSRYDFIVGCDGAHSTVRELSGIAFSGSDYGLHFVMGDVAFEGGRRQVWTTYHLW